MPNPLASIAGFGVTFGTMFRRVVTEEYPEQPHPVAPRFHGRHQLNRYPDGLEKCIGCELCAWACPADAIYVEGEDNTEDERYSPGERYGSVYQINYLRCILCGLCIEACPTRALTMTNEYDLADYTRESLIYEKQDLLAPMLPGMEEPPHPMRLGETERDYYAPEPAAGASGSGHDVGGSAAGPAAGASGSGHDVGGSAAGPAAGASGSGHDVGGSAAGPAAGAPPAGGESTGGDA